MKGYVDVLMQGERTWRPEERQRVLLVGSFEEFWPLGGAMSGPSLLSSSTRRLRDNKLNTCKWTRDCSLMSHLRPPRFNAKVRQSTVGSTKKKGIRGNAAIQDSNQVDPNAEILVPKSREEKERGRKEKMLQEVRRFA
jgi:hypothetical protein